MQATMTVERESIVTLEEKFMRLLETDRTSPEFERLFAEVNAEMDACLAAEEK